MKPIHVLIADDHPIVRDGICTLLQAHPRMKIAFVAASFEEVGSFLKTPSASDIDIMILDLVGMGPAPISFLTSLYRENPNARVIIFSSELKFAPDFTEIGVQGYIAKEEMGQHLTCAIEAIMANGTYFSSLVAEYIDRASAVRKKFQLAPREVTILQYLSEGYVTDDIAIYMHIKKQSVQNYITELRCKLLCSSRTQLVDWYRKMYLGS